MSPQEKAKELVYKYKDAPFNCVGCDMPFCDVPCTMLNIDESKQCALIAVNEIIHESSEKIYRLGRCCLVDREYWQEVKQEIEKL